MSSKRLTDAQELLLRQVHPEFVQAGRLSSRAFNPSKSHAFKLSVSRRSKTEPAAAYRLHVHHKKLQSVGVWAVTVGECDTCDLAAYEDPVAASEQPRTVADPAHAYIDFESLSNKERKKKAELLRQRAMDRGCLYTEQE